MPSPVLPSGFEAPHGSRTSTADKIFALTVPRRGGRLGGTARKVQEDRKVAEKLEAAEAYIHTYSSRAPTNAKAIMRTRGCYAQFPLLRAGEGRSGPAGPGACIKLSHDAFQASLLRLLWPQAPAATPRRLTDALGAPGSASATRKLCITPSKLVLALLAILAHIPAHAAFGFKLDGSLDKEAISEAYFEGDFHKVLPPLKTYRQNFPETATKEDSIFVYKYLSVIYAADSSTKAKAESYMVQLLRLTPAISLIDLYISDQIQSLFNNVKKRFLEQQKYVKEFDANGQPLAERKGKLKSKKWVWWTLGGVGTAAAITGAVVLLSDNDEDRPSRVKVGLE